MKLFASRHSRGRPDRDDDDAMWDDFLGKLILLLVAVLATVMIVTTIAYPQSGQKAPSLKTEELDRMLSAIALYPDAAIAAKDLD